MIKGLLKKQGEKVITELSSIHNHLLQIKNNIIQKRTRWNRASFPNRLDLIEMYMKLCYSDKTCIVFSNPNEHIEEIDSIAKMSDWEKGSALNAEYAIFICKNIVVADHFCSMINDKKYVMVFVNGKLINNT